MSRLQRSARRLSASAPGSWLARHIAPRIDPAIFRFTHGEHTASSFLAGVPVAFLTTSGARTGQRRTAPVLAFPTRDGLVVIASNFGQARHPAWYYNLQANPEGELLLDGQTRPVRARQARGEQRDRIWREGLRVYPGWAAYERRAENREIAVFILETAAP